MSSLIKGIKPMKPVVKTDSYFIFKTQNSNVDIEVSNAPYAKDCFELAIKSKGQYILDPINVPYNKWESNYWKKEIKKKLQHKNLEDDAFGNDVVSGFLLGLRDIIAQLILNQQDEANKKKSEYNLTPEDEKEVIDFLESVDLMKKIIEEIRKTGLVSETKNGLIILFTLISSLTKDPQNLKFTAQSSVGKSAPVVMIMKLFPKDMVMAGTFTKKSVYHDYGTEDEEGNYIVSLKNKVIVCLEEEASMEFLTEIKPILSHDVEEIVYKFTEKQTEGKLKAKKVIVKGWPAYIGLSTQTERAEELSTREWTGSPISTPEKFKAVNIDTAVKHMLPEEFFDKPTDIIQKTVDFLKNQKKETIIMNPHTHKILEAFPYNQPRCQRDFKKLLAMVEIITYLHQYQRFTIETETRKYVFSTWEDVCFAVMVMDEMLESTLTGIPKEVIDFYNRVLKEHRKDLLTYRDIADLYTAEYNKHYHPRTIQDKYIPTLENSGLIYIDRSEKTHKVSVLPERIENSDKLRNSRFHNELRPEDMCSYLNSIVRKIWERLKGVYTPEEIEGYILLYENKKISQDVIEAVSKEENHTSRAIETGFIILRNILPPQAEQSPNQPETQKPPEKTPQNYKSTETTDEEGNINKLVVEEIDMALKEQAKNPPKKPFKNQWI